MAARYRHLPLGGSLAADFTPRPDGTTLVLSSEPLRDYPKRLTDRGTSSIAIARRRCGET